MGSSRLRSVLMTEALEAFAEFFVSIRIWSGRRTNTLPQGCHHRMPSRNIAELPDREKTGLLTCVTDRNPHVANARPATIRTRRPGYNCETATWIDGEITWNAFNYPGLPVDSGRC